MSKAGKAKTSVNERKASTIADIRIAHTLAQTQGKSSTTRWILCPWLEHFSGDRGIWLSVLAAHDANGTLLEVLPSSGKYRPNVYAAVFAVDVLRTTTHLINCIKKAGIGGVINLPSVSFIDGEAGLTLDRLSMGVEREIDFLEACAQEGLRIAGVVASVQSAKRLLAAGADFLIAHGGPPLKSEKNCDEHMTVQLEALARSKALPVISLTQLSG